jgi:hypothetical protein
MDMLQCIDTLNQASSYELFRIQIAMRRILEDPARINSIKQQLRIGQTVTYFDIAANKEISATLLEINRSRVFVQNHHDGKKWTLTFCMLNISGTKVDINKSSRRVDRLTLKVGDHIGYISRDGIEVYGVVTKLNQKTASVTIASGAKWRVSYSLLFHVMDSTRGATELIYDAL